MPYQSKCIISIIKQSMSLLMGRNLISYHPNQNLPWTLLHKNRSRKRMNRSCWSIIVIIVAKVEYFGSFKCKKHFLWFIWKMSQNCFYIYFDNDVLLSMLFSTRFNISTLCVSPFDPIHQFILYWLWYKIWSMIIFCWRSHCGKLDKIFLNILRVLE